MAQQKEVPFIPPLSSLIYRGVVIQFDQKKGYGFVHICALLRENPYDNFDYNWLAPIGERSMVHFSDIVTDANIRRDQYTILKPHQNVYFNLELNEHGKYKCINLKSESIISPINLGDRDKTERKQQDDQD